MKKLLFLFSFVFIIFLGNTFASGGGGGGSYSPTYITSTSTNSGGIINIPAEVSKTVSFSNELSSIVFSKSNDISIKTLEGGIWKDVGNNVSDFKPLQGFIITNYSGDDLNITYKYKANIDSLSSLIQKRLSAGWNLIGIARNGTGSEYTSILNGLGYSFDYSQIVDFTATDFGVSNNTQTLSSNFGVKNRDEYGNIFEDKAYAVFSNVSSILGGVQNLTDNNGNLIYRSVIQNEDEKPIVEQKKYFNISGNNISNTFILGYQNARVYQADLSTYSGSKLENLSFIITGYDGIDENNTVAFTATDFEDLRLTYSGNTIATNPTITQSGANVFIVKFDNINYIFDNFSQSCDSTNGQFTINSTIYKCFVLEKNIQTTLPEDNFSIKLDINYTKVSYNEDYINNSSDNYDLLDGIFGQGNIKLRKASYLSTRGGQQERLALSQEKDVIFSDLIFRSEYGDTKITELYFANDYNDDNGIDADISNEIIENIKLKVNDLIHTGTVVLNNGRLAITGLDIVIPKYTNSGNDSAIKLLGDIALIDSDTKTNKKINFKLTDIKAQNVDNGNILTKVGEGTINKQFPYALHEGLNISGNTITTRKSTFITNTINLTDTVLDNGEKTIWKGNITASGGDVSLSSLSFNFNGFLNNTSIENLSLSGSSSNTGSYLVDNNGNKVLSDINLYVNGQKVEYRNSSNKVKDLNYYINNRCIRTTFTPIDINSGNTTNIELKATFSNLKGNDYFYITPQGYCSFNVLWSDKSAGVNHSEISNDWFHENSWETPSYNNFKTSGTLIKE